MFDYFKPMSRIAKPFVWTASFALLAGVAHAAALEATELPYKVILTRNAFNLKPPPPPPPDTPIDTGPPPTLKLPGIIGITAPRKAMFEVEPLKGEPTYLTVKEGDFSEGALLKVVEIDEQLGTVKIAMNGTTHTLDFEKNGIKNAVAPAPVAAGKPAGLPSIPGMAQPGVPPPPAGGGTPVQFNAKPTTPSAPGSAPSPSLQSIRTRSLRVQPGQPQSQLGPAVPDKPLTVEQSVILKKADEFVNQDKINKRQYPPPVPVPGLDQ